MVTPRVIIEEASTLTDELAASFVALLPQLSSTPPDLELLKAVIDAEESALLVACIEGRIVGMCTLVTFPIPSGIRCWIEDVVVDTEVRGHGIGAELVNAAIARAKAAGARSVDLTSRPSRLDANRLYERLGFQQRETNVYRYLVGD